MATSDEGQRGLKRPRYFDRQQLRAEDLVLEQTYNDRRLERINRHLNGCGVVCGLEVKPVSAGVGAGKELQVVVTPGYALSPRGEEIWVGAEQTVGACLPKSIPHDCGNLTAGGAATGQRSYLAVRYSEQQCAPMPAVPEACGPGARWENSRICESFEIQCFDQNPGTCAPLDGDCGRLSKLIYGPEPKPQTAAGSDSLCPPDSDSPWVVLAALSLTAEGLLEVDYSVRSQVVGARFLDAILRCGLAGIAAITPDEGEQGETIEAVICGWGLDDIRYLTFSGAEVQGELIAEQIRQMSHDGYVRRVIYSPDGKLLATIGDYRDRTARVWDAGSGQEIGRLNLGNAPVDIGFGPDASWLAVAQGDGSVHIWAFMAGQVIRVLHHGTSISSMACSPVGPYVAVTGDARVSVWEAVGGLQMSLFAPGTYIRDVRFSPDGRFLWGRCDDNSVRQWDFLAGLQVNSFANANWLNDWDLSPDGRYLATADISDHVRIIDTRSRAGIVSLTLSDHILNVTFSPDGRHLAVVCSRFTGPWVGNVRIFDAHDGNQFAGFNSDEGISDILFSPDGRTLATIGFNYTVEVWDNPSYGRITSVSHDHAYLGSGVYSPHGDLTTVGYSDIRIWRIRSGTGNRLPVRITIGNSAKAGLRSFQLHSLERVIDSTDRKVFFTVSLPAPAITTISPDNGFPGTAVEVTISGRHLSGATRVTFQGSGITATVLYGADTYVAARLAISAYATPGYRTFQVTTPRGIVDSQAFGIRFRVISPYGYYPYGYGKGWTMAIGGSLL